MGRHLITAHTRVVAENRLQGSKTTARVWDTVPPPYRAFVIIGGVNKCRPMRDYAETSMSAIRRLKPTVNKVSSLLDCECPVR
ncbi:MAG: hypothetical protein LBD53_01735 [Tannerella sp.]|jgi:hypothetical protein|nr:hypothetical protein [Tannerella sp.]